MDNKRPQRVLLGVFVVFVVFVATVVGAAWYLNRGPLVGETSHDFGVMLIEDGAYVVTQHHTFELQNASDRTVRIATIRPSCGCTKAEASRSVIKPGETAAVETALTLSTTGEKSTHATIVYQNGDRQKLYLRGVGRRANPLKTAASALSIGPDLPVTLRVTLEMTDRDATPDEPVIETPGEVSAEFSGWQKDYAGDRSRKKPALWGGRLRVQQVKQSLPDDAQLVIAMPSLSDKARLEIPLQPGGQGMIVGDGGSISIGQPAGENEDGEQEQRTDSSNENDQSQ